jgi:hypothetical protein
VANTASAQHSSISHAQLWAEIDAVARGARHVRLSENRLVVFAQSLASMTQDVPVPFWRDPDGHPGVMPGTNDARLIQFVCVYMSCCFCIWRQRTAMPMVTLDSVCWATGAIRCRRCSVGVDPAEVPCALRPSCLGFNQEGERMAAGWPLVLTTRY